MYSNVTYYEKDNELHEIHFPVGLGGLMGVNAPGETSNTSDFNKTEIILLMFTESQDLYLRVYIDLIFWQSAKSWFKFQVLTEF